jgi:hypothetical protein
MTSTDARASASRWRAGERDDAARAGHADDMSERRRRASEETLDDAARAKLLALVTGGTSITDAARQVGTTQQHLRAIAQWNEPWADALDDACRAGADPDTPHGTTSGYRIYRCRCRECRAAHHPAAGLP